MNVKRVLDSLNLNQIKEELASHYHNKGPGRTPINPLSMLKAQLAKHLLRIPSDRRLALRLKHDRKLARSCGFRNRTPSHGLFTHFRHRLGEKTYERIFNAFVRLLIDSRTIVGAKRILPLASVLAPANENEKRHAPSLVERTRMVLGKAEARLRCLIGDSQYSSAKVRGLVDCAVIPYTSGQRGDGLRVDRMFRAHGPEGLVAEYRKRPAVEALFAYVKSWYGLTVVKVRGLLNVSVYSLLSLLCIVLNREAAENLGRPHKALSPTFFNV